MGLHASRGVGLNQRALAGGGNIGLVPSMLSDAFF